MLALGAGTVRAQEPPVITLPVITLRLSPRESIEVAAEKETQVPQDAKAKPEDDFEKIVPPDSGITASSEGPGELDEDPFGPTPLNKVGILQNLLFGEDADAAKIKFSGWLDLDYTYRSTGPGRTDIAPVMNRFGNEFLLRQIGLYVSKPLDPNAWSWGFNSIFIGGADASFLGPTAGGWENSNPRFGGQWTDLSLTAHLPILTAGGVDIKAGRQTTILGPVGALPWQRYFNSCDYAWYNLEEGRYTGVSSIWHVTSRLHWYNGVEIGGWGVFFANPAHAASYITNITYWLDEDAQRTKVWTTVLTGSTGFFEHGNTTTVEAGLLHNWNRYVYQIVDAHITYSKAPLFFAPPPGYQQRAYDLYTIVGLHVNRHVDFNTRFEWYKDVDGGGYPGGFGIPHTDYFEMTYGIDYHPTRWVQVRPEIRYDHATNPAFGEARNQADQLSLAMELFLKF